ncbi:MAG: C25 family cysteine peptidase [Candidatus Hatepunaea meridiana]|nr:C25 family cysteine peptidase [Candidatus Hatepunaea meridiana]
MTTPKPCNKSLIVSIIVVFLLVLGVNSAFAQSTGCTINTIHSDNSGFEMDVEILDLNISPQEQDGFNRKCISIFGESTLAAPGLPELPHINRLIVVPPTARIEVDWSGSDPVIMESVHPTMIPYEGSPEDQKMLKKMDYSHKTGYWPCEVVELGKPAIMRGVRVVRLTVNPVQVDAATGNIRFRERINVRLNFTEGQAVNPVVNAAKQRPSLTATRLIRSLVINPEAICRDQEHRGSYLYIIPDYDGVAEAIEPLADWRKRQGYPTEVIAVDQRASNVDVLRVIENAYFEWDVPPEIVCLVGDADRVAADFMIATWDVGRAYPWETDYTYTCIEGDDLLPEMAIGRISARSVRELEGIVDDKIYPYEVEPYMEETEWYQSAALMSNDHRTGYSSIYLQRWLRNMLIEVGVTEVDTFYYIWDNEVTGREFIENNINNGILVFNYRGWGQFSGDWSVARNDVDRLTNGQMLPFLVLPTCNSGDFMDHIQFSHGYTEDFLWGDRGGAVGAIGSSGYTHTNYNNVLDGGIMNGLFRDKAWQFGWSLVQGKIELYRHFGMFNDVMDPQVNSLRVWEAHCYQSNLIGDPGTQLWTSVPQEMNVSHPEEVSIGENQLIVTVIDEEETPVPDATVVLMFEGEHLRIGETNVEGRVVFVFEPDELEAGTLHITVTKHDYIPYLAEIDVPSPNEFLGVSSFTIDDDNDDESHGNDDGQPNPGERIELQTRISNFGENVPEGGIEFTLEGVVGNVEIVDGEALLDNAPDMDESSEVTFVVDLSNECWNNQRMVLNVTASNDDNEWESPIEFFIAAPDVESVDFSFDPEPFDVSDTVWVEVTFHNEGQIASPAMSAELISLQDAVVVFNPFSEIGAIALEEGDTLASARFRIHAYEQAVPGTYVRMMVAFESEAGFKDTTYFSYTVDNAEDGTPFGPDAYGYGCFDNTDTDWDIAPEYDWIEIAPDLDGDGTDTEINDIGNELDKSLLVDLPFTFRYYGEDFDEISICSNGWFAFGDEAKLADFQNRRIPPALGPRAQVCVFWDDLVNYRENRNRIGGIYYWYDEQNHRFIIEWSRMRRYIGQLDEHRMRPGSVNTFQAILYDPQVSQTYTGDGDIVLQYHTVHNDPDVDPTEFDTPYATVGIVNLNGTDGMEYTYWNEYPDGAAVLDDERAIKFTTALIIVTGAVRGTVTDVETGDPIPNAEIRGNPTSFGIVNENGEFHFNVLVGDSYSFTAWAPGYNTQTIEDVDIVKDETDTLEFSLTHPEFDFSEQEVEMELAPDHATVSSVTISNNGNGPLHFRSLYDYAGEQDERWQRLLDFNVTDSTDDDRVHGVGFLDDHIWVTGSNGRINPNRFYHFNRNGQYAGRIDQPTASSYGFRGTAIVGDLIYGGEGNWIIGVNAEGEPQDSIPGPMLIQRALAYDLVTETFWVANATDSIFQIDRDGQILSRFDNELNIQGLGFLADDPDGYPLYIVSQNKTDPDLQVPEALVTKLDPLTGDSKTEAVLEGELEDRVGGMEIVSTFDHRKWVMLAVLTSPNGDRVSVYDMGPNTNWVSYSPIIDTVAAGEDVEIEVVFNAAGLDVDVYDLVIRFFHNAAGLETTLPIVLTVDPDAPVESENRLPYQFTLNQNYPNPFNSMTSIAFTLPEASLTKLRVFDITGRQIASLIEDRIEAGYHTIAFEAGALPSGIYLVKLESGGGEALIKVALIR